MTKTISECLQKFKKEIRRSDLQQIKARKRNELLIFISRQDLIDQFHSHSNSHPITSLSDIVQNCQHVLINPIPLPRLLTDEKQMIRIESHINLYRQIYLQKSHEPIMQNLIQLVLQIIARYTCLEIHKQTEYQAEFYKLISLVLDNLCEGEKQKIVRWVQNKESIWLVYNIISQVENVTSQTYPNIFDIIVEALCSQDQLYQVDAVLFLAKIIKFSQKIDLFHIYQQFFNISQLIIKIISRRLQRKQCDLMHFWTPLIYLFSTFDQAIINYARTGIIGICAQLIDTNDQSNMFGALQMLNIFCEVRQNKIIHLLLQDEHNPPNLWIDSCLQKSLFRHSNLRIRRSFVRLMRNIIKRVSMSQLKIFWNRFALAGHSFLECLQGLLSFQDQNIQILGLECVQRLLLHERGMEKQQLQGILANLQKHNIVKHINFLNNHKLQQVRQICGDLLDNIHQIRRRNQVYQI